MRPALVLLLAACLLAPFAAKPFHTDDPLFVWSGTALSANLLAPYSGSVNWFGETQPMLEVMHNPPGLPYVIAFLNRIGCSSEVPLHWVLLAPALCLVLVVTRWASARKEGRPALAGLLLVASPAFLVSSTNVLPDVPMAACVTAALFLWMRGIDRGRSSDLYAAAVACALASLCKYFAASLIPFLALHALLERRSARQCLPPLVLAALPLSIYELSMWIKTGSPPFLSGFRAVGGDANTRDNVGIARALTSIVFLGGACLPMCGLLVARCLRSVRTLLICVAVALLGALLIDRHRLSSSSSPSIVRGEIALFAVVGGAALIYLARCWRSREREDRWLIAWVIWELLYSTFLNWSVTERGFLTSVPIVCILISTRSQDRSEGTAVARTWILAAPIVLALALGLALNVADQEIATSGRRAADEIVLAFVRAGKHVWFQGHWGFQYYAEAHGAKPMEPGAAAVAAGDIVVIPMLNTNIPGVAKHDFRIVEVRTYPIDAPLTTLGPASCGGFYSSILGALPFGANLGDKSDYWVLEHP